MITNIICLLLPAYAMEEASSHKWQFNTITPPFHPNMERAWKDYEQPQQKILEDAWNQYIGNNRAKIIGLQLPEGLPTSWLTFDREVYFDIMQAKYFRSGRSKEEVRAMFAPYMNDEEFITYVGNGNSNDLRRSRQVRRIAIPNQNAINIEANDNQNNNILIQQNQNPDDIIGHNDNQNNVALNPNANEDNIGPEPNEPLKFKWSYNAIPACWNDPDQREWMPYGEKQQRILEKAFNAEDRPKFVALDLDNYAKSTMAFDKEYFYKKLQEFYWNLDSIEALKRAYPLKHYEFVTYIDDDKSRARQVQRKPIVEESKRCGICIENAKDHALSCGHMICGECAPNFGPGKISKTCPFCRMVLTNIILKVYLD